MMANYRLLHLHQVEQKTGFSKSWIYQQIQERQFPRAIRIGSTCIAWLESDVDDWIQKQINQNPSTLR